MLAARVGELHPVLIDTVAGDGGGYRGRTPFQAPEVDGLTIIQGPGELRVGSVIPVRITHAMDYDLVGEPE